MSDGIWLVAVVSDLLSRTSISSGVCMQQFSFVHFFSPGHPGALSWGYIHMPDTTIWHFCVCGPCFYKYAPLNRSDIPWSLICHSSYFILKGSGLLLYRSFLTVLFLTNLYQAFFFSWRLRCLMFMFNCSCCCLCSWCYLFSVVFSWYLKSVILISSWEVFAVISFMFQ